MNRRPDSPETGHFLRARTRAPAMGSAFAPGEAPPWRRHRPCPSLATGKAAIRRMIASLAAGTGWGCYVYIPDLRTTLRPASTNIHLRRQLPEHDITACKQGPGLDPVRKLQAQQHRLALPRIPQAAEQPIAPVQRLAQHVELRD